ncbi:MAG: M14 family zinc carboxypeptidase [Planctomycetota bacterium]|nr:M14 family zinc carboxypeptidase [Planctomycetota bacterium]
MRRRGTERRAVVLGTALALFLAPAPSAQGQGEPRPTPEEAAQDPSETPAQPAPEDDVPPPPAPHYLGSEEVSQRITGWLGTGLAERIELGTSAGGRPIEALQFGGAGATPLSERPTILLIGGLDGVSLAGSEAVLRVTRELLAAPDQLPPNATFIAVPWANPDGLSSWLDSFVGGGRNAGSVDLDHDGKKDEDGPDDLDGDGRILELLLPDPDGPWTRAEDDRLLRAARPGDAPRFRLAREGRDDDGDGRFNEDGPGGVVPDLNFPVGWRGPWTGVPSGRWPLSESESRSLADLAIDRRTAVVLLFQGNHGGLAVPGGLDPAGPVEGGAGPLALPLPSDLVVFEEVGRLFAQATGRGANGVRTLREARGVERPGAAIDWFYVALGALSFELAAWGPEVENGTRSPKEARFAADANLDDDPAAEPVTRWASATDRAWARWLDNTRGGVGFVDWQPVDLGDGRRGFVGGWLPRTRLNPPPEVLPVAVEGLADFTLEVARGLPRLEIELRELKREPSGVVHLKARIRNEGILPSGVGPLGDAGGASLTLRVPPGVQLVVGEEKSEFGHIAGLSASPDCEWILVAPEGAVLQLVARSPWLAPVEREVRP